jgi:hypothetical protein
VRFCGDVAEGVQQYESLNEAGDGETQSFLSIHDPIKQFVINQCDQSAESGGSKQLEMTIVSEECLTDFRLRISFYNATGAIVAEANHRSTEFEIALSPGANVFLLDIASIPLRAGRYQIGCNIIDRHGDLIAWSFKQQSVIVIGGAPMSNSDCQLVLSNWTRAVCGEVV